MEVKLSRARGQLHIQAELRIKSQILLLLCHYMCGPKMCQNIYIYIYKIFLALNMCS